MKLTRNAKECELTVQDTYSGRNMLVRRCPVHGDSVHDLRTAVAVHIDNLGLGFVAYAMY